VALTTAFGVANLKQFTVWTDEIKSDQTGTARLNSDLQDATIPRLRSGASDFLPFAVARSFVVIQSPRGAFPLLVELPTVSAAAWRRRLRSYAPILS